jgi:hypothetical protein
MAMFDARPVLDAETLDAVRQIAGECGLSEDRQATISHRLQALKTTPAMRDCIQSHLQAASSKNLATRLAKRLDNDAAFRGAFTAQA